MQQLRPVSPMSIAAPADTSLLEAWEIHLLPLLSAGYTRNITQLWALCQGTVQVITVEPLRTFFRTHALLHPVTRVRKQATVARFLAWVEQHMLINNNSMRKIGLVKLEPSQPQGVERTLKAIPAGHPCDQLSFRLLAETGLRVGEELSLYVENFDLSLDNEYITIIGKCERRRTILLDDPRLVQQLRTYLKRMGYKRGPLRYQLIQERSQRSCSQTGVTYILHQLRRFHATEIINSGVRLLTIRKRLGHKRPQTNSSYIEQADEAADAEMREWRRQRQHR